MNSCPNCQQPVKTKSGFCPSCGTNYQITQGRPKWLFPAIISIFAALVVFFAHGQIKEKTGAFTTIIEFENMLEKQDSQTASTLFKSQLEDVHSSEETINDFLEYVDSETDWQTDVKEWKKTALRERNNYLPIKSSSGDRIFTLEEKGSFLGIYPTYEVVIHPFSLQVKSEVPDTKVSFNKKSAVLKNEEYQKLGYFLPTYSEQEIAYSVKSKYSEIEDSLYFASYTEEPNKVFVHIPIEAAMISVLSNEPDAIVFINGESTKKKVKDIGEIGPLPTDGSISIHAVIDDRESYSEEVYSGGDYELYFEEDYTDVVMDSYSEDEDSLPTMDELEDLFDSFQELGVEAINSQDFSLVEDYYHPDGISGPEAANYVNYLNTKGITEQLLESEVVDYELVDEGIHLYTFESYMIYYTDKPDAQKSFNTEHLLINDNGEWKFYELLKTTEI